MTKRFVGRPSSATHQAVYPNYGYIDKIYIHSLHTEAYEGCNIDEILAI